ncbi:MAG: hypothetical protein MZU95_09615 [Desulfomicrobium escambiense]|nr:hypothetical protein [Desulfomicrobium escambiense]
MLNGLTGACTKAVCRRDRLPAADISRVSALKAERITLSRQTLDGRDAGSSPPWMPQERPWCQRGWWTRFSATSPSKEGLLIYISQTGSSLDELQGRIDCTTMDGSSTCEITSSSELCAHVRIYELTGDPGHHTRPPEILGDHVHDGRPLDFEQTRGMWEVSRLWPAKWGQGKGSHAHAAGGHDGRPCCHRRRPRHLRLLGHLFS